MLTATSPALPREARVGITWTPEPWRQGLTQEGQQHPCEPPGMQVWKGRFGDTLLLQDSITLKDTFH